jgi:hypothetical protein
MCLAVNSGRLKAKEQQTSGHPFAGRTSAAGFGLKI